MALPMTTMRRQPSEQPRLEAGDRLTRIEFERRYAASPGIKKAELLDGVVYMPSPVSYRHGHPHSLLDLWLGLYALRTPGTAVSSDTTLRLDMDNEPQPDLMLRIEGPRGASRVDDDGYVSGPPELCVEVATSSVSYDLHQKKHVYRRAGVREYLVLRTEDAAVDWWTLRDGEYVALAPDAGGVLQSTAFPGLWLDPDLLLAGDGAGLERLIGRGTATAAHGRFVASLR